MNVEGSLVVSQQEFPVREGEVGYAKFCVQDFPKFLGPEAMKYVQMHPMTHGIGHVEMRADGWEITLTESTTEDEDFGIFHTGFIRREDSSPFSVDELKHLTNALTYFFSFVTGAYRTPAVVIAHNAEHERVWGQYGRFHQSQYIGDNWFRRHHGRALAEMFPGFWDSYRSCESKVQTVIGLYCESSMIARSGLHKNALVTSRSALQSISKWQLGRDSIPAKDIKLAMNACGIRFDNRELRRITDVRDEIDHGDFFTPEYQEIFDLWKLSQKYVELMLFKRFCYEPPADTQEELRDGSSSS